MKVNHNEIGSGAEMEVQLRGCSIYAVEEIRDLIQKRTRKQHAVHPDLDSSASFFDVYDGHEGKVVAKFCAKFLQQQVLKQEAYPTGNI
ncbi:probable protein phosphatase 2C 60 [Tanacetum coccineum]